LFVTLAAEKGYHRCYIVISLNKRLA
jgi:hypothetical protein